MADYSQILQKATSEAKDFIDNPSKLDRLLVELEAKLKEVPAIGEKLADLPLIIAMVKSWIKKEYQVNGKVLAIMVGALLYLVKKKDLIPDSIPVIGLADDIAVWGLALHFVEPELNEYRAWRNENHSL